MNNKSKLENFEDLEIDFIEILSSLLKNIKLISIVSVIFTFAGIIYSISIPNKYKSSSTFYLHYEKMDRSSGLENLAGLAGINLQGDNADIVPPNLYPKLISSTSFKLEILDEIIIYDNNNIKYRDYLLKNNNGSIIDFKKIFLFPIELIRNLLTKDDSVSSINNNLLNKIQSIELIYTTEDDDKLFKLLENKILIEVNDQDGFIELSVYDKDPIVSSIIAKKANEILQKSILDFKLKNINDVFNFTSSQLLIAKNNLYKIQDSLANFRDSNKSIKSDLFLNKENRLETEFNISKNIYNELAVTKEKTAIDVRRNTPIFTIINNVVIPNKKDSPNRSLIVIIFFFLGLITTSFWVLIKNPTVKFIEEIKSNNL